MYCGFDVILEFIALGMRKTMHFDNKADARRYAAVCNARILSIEVSKSIPENLEDEEIII